ncbi:MAG: deoxyhypusine synthase, partial [Planctomycetales bacterium]|nr:deoxyhypusine synthase [Planctomycetales bacterium]NIP68719.1 deoxyhypusine synthase [Planctomycetales bacterium]
LLQAMSKTAFGGRQLGEAFEILLEIAQRPQCHTVLTVSGAMTVAKQGLIICDMIERGLVQAVVCTGALVAHGLTESIGLTHYRADPSRSDQTLFEQGYNRIYDTLEMEANLNEVEQLIRDVVRPAPTEDAGWSSASLCQAIGERLDQLDHGPGILRSAWRHEVPVFIPAFTDSEVGLDVSIATMLAARQAAGQPASGREAGQLWKTVPPFNPFLDLQQYAQFALQAEELAIFTIGGGVPRNWAQQVGPYVDITNHRLGTNLPPVRFRYGVRICPEPAHWGGLSGCSYSEGVSWGKFVAPAEGGRFAEVHADATVVWPLLMKAVFQKLDRD